MLRDALSPEDVFAEVAVRACLGFVDSKVEVEELRPWVFGIARNVLREELRSMGRDGKPNRPQRLHSSIANRLSDRLTRLSIAVARDELAQRAMKEIELLPEQDRRLILYHGIEELSLVETAKLIGLGYETARKRWQRLRVKLQQLV